MIKPEKITIAEWDTLYQKLKKSGMVEPFYGGSLSRHIKEGDLRLLKLVFDNSAAALRLWNFLLTEEKRLHKAKKDHKYIIGAMKDLGTVPVMAYSIPDIVTFYPDGAWWIPCIMELSAGLLKIADELGISESFCPVRAMLGAFVSGSHFPKPDLLFCSAGAICDDFSAIAQRLESLGFEINWWEIPNRREVECGEQSVTLPSGFHAPMSQFEIVKSEIERIRQILEEKTGNKLNDKMLADGIKKSNQIRDKILKIRNLVFSSTPCPLPALELLIVEMLALHFCSDREECDNVLDELLSEVEKRVEANIGIADSEAVKVFWVNPVADLKVMNLLEDSGFCLCGTDFMFGHALERIPEDLPPVDALALTALDDPMIGTIADRGKRISNEIKTYKPDAVIISRIPGASHCAFEGRIIGDIIHDHFQIPVLEIEVPPLSDAMSAGIRNKFQALHETVKAGLQSENY